MARSTLELPGGLLELPGTGATWRRVYGAIREAILEGRLSPGARLPSTRTLARQLGIGRNSVVAAFEQLTAEGFIHARHGAGAFVSSQLPVAPASLQLEPRRSPGRRPTATPGRVSGQSEPPDWLGDVRPFALGIPALALFPLDLWARLARRCWRDASQSDLSYGAPGGVKALREAIAQHLRATRAVRCGWRQVFIVPGVQHALALAAGALLEQGARIWVEDPGFARAWTALESAGARPVGVPLDTDGLDLSAARRRAPDARAVYVTPSHQFPLGITMTLARRLALLETARRDDRWIMEDDYDSEFRYAGPPLAALQGIDSADRVVYLGSFSKALAPALRIAYLVAPDSAVDRVAALQLQQDRLVPTVDQRVLAAFFAEGHFSRHIQRMRATYRERTEALVDALESHLAGALEIRPPQAGLHVVATFSRERSDRVVAARARALGLHVRPLRGFARHVRTPPGLVLGAAAFDVRQIRRAVRRLAEAFDSR